MSEEKQLNTDSNTDGDEEEEEYVVEEILKHRINKKGKSEYFLKWKGFPSEENTWEPAENLNCPELIEKYEKQVLNKFKKKERPTKSVTETLNSISPGEKKSSSKRKHLDDGSSRKKRKSDKRLTGFDRGMDAEEILGATETSGEVHFLIKWKGVNDAELVPSKIANVRIPQMVIKFYEARLTWSNTGTKLSDETETEMEQGKSLEETKEVATNSV